MGTSPKKVIRLRSGSATMPIENVQSQTVSRLREAIIGGTFSPGERLVENALCQRFGVSRTSIREALRRLEAESLVVITPNVGPSVASMDWEAAAQIYDVRALLEGRAAALCAERASPETIAKIRVALDAFEAAAAHDDPVARIRSTENFYDAILIGCGNKELHSLVRGLIARISLLRATSMSRQGRAMSSALELRRIFQEIASGNPSGASAAATDHIRCAAAAARIVFAEQVGNESPRDSAKSGSPGSPDTLSIWRS